MAGKAPVLIKDLYQSMHKHPADRTVVVVRKQEYSFGELSLQTKAYAALMQQSSCERIAIFGTRSFEDYCAVLAALLSTTTFVNLNSYFPAHKSGFIFGHSEANALLICNEEASAAFEMLTEHCTAERIKQTQFFFTATTKAQLEQLTESFANAAISYTVTTSASSLPQGDAVAMDCGADAVDSESCSATKMAIVEALKSAITNALILPESEEDKAQIAAQFDFDKVLAEYDPYRLQMFMYTSGTTGQPKGVVDNYESYSWYFYALVERIGFNEHDVFSHFSEMTFDLSLEDFFIPVLLGGKVVCPSKKDMLNQIGYIEKNGITVYHSMPSFITHMERVGIVPKAPIESVRIAYFAGEPLLFKQLHYLSTLFPNCRMFNTYGPTECTVILGVEEATKDDIAEHMRMNNGNSIVPLGVPLKDGIMIVCDEHGNELPDGVQGEMLIGGPQVSVGYLNNPELTAQVYIEHDGGRFYKTGDQVVYKNHLDEKTGKTVRKLHYIGRFDDMVKVGGYRISLYESDEVLRSLTNKAVRTVAYELEDEIGKSNILVAVIEGASEAECEQVMSTCADVMELYMRPRLVLSMENFPLNSNGKVDRKQIKAYFESYVHEHIKLHHNLSDGEV